ALIFSYEAYQLESDLHNYFDKYRINKINHRKEFFRVPIDEIESKLEEYKNLTIDFNRNPDAEEYYQSISINNKDL
ncbi:GIY-YIG nuclease family protein, partial [Enterococcus gallinarum]